MEKATLITSSKRESEECDSNSKHLKMTLEGSFLHLDEADTQMNKVSVSLYNPSLSSEEYMMPSSKDGRAHQPSALNHFITATNGSDDITGGTKFSDVCSDFRGRATSRENHKESELTEDTSESETSDSFLLEACLDHQHAEGDVFSYDDDDIFKESKLCGCDDRQSKVMSCHPDYILSCRSEESASKVDMECECPINFDLSKLTPDNDDLSMWDQRPVKFNF